MTDQGWFQNGLLTQETKIKDKKGDRIFPSQLKKKKVKTQPFIQKVNDKSYSNIQKESNTLSDFKKSL